MPIKRPISILLTDLHLSDETTDDCLDICMQALMLAKELNVDTILNGGDTFNSRKSQTMDSLISFKLILDKYQEAGVKMIAIDGNHDKLMYNSEDSYMDVYSTHPALEMVKTHKYNVLNKSVNDRDRSDDAKISMVSFFSDDNQCKSNESYIRYLKMVSVMTDTHPNCKQILVTHHGFSGARSNSGVLIQSDISTDHVSKFHKVLVGHYHDRSVVGRNITYVGACRQSCFTEDKDKGFTIIYSDGSVGFHKADFKEYTELAVNLDGEHDNLKIVDAMSMVSRGKGTNHNYYKRLHLIGSNVHLRSIDINSIKSKGVEVRQTDISDVVGEVSGGQQAKFVSFDEQSLAGLFVEFLEEEAVREESDIEYGMELLGRAVNNYKLTA